MRVPFLAAAALAVTCAVTGCTATVESQDERSGGSDAPLASASPDASSSDAAPRTRDAWSEQLSAVCRQQAALTLSLAIAPHANPDDVELGVRQLADAAAAVLAPSGDTEVSAAQGQLNEAVDTWLALARAISTSAAEREAGAGHIRAAIDALTAAGASDCERLSR